LFICEATTAQPDLLENEVTLLDKHANCEVTTDTFKGTLLEILASI